MLQGHGWDDRPWTQNLPLPIVSILLEILLGVNGAVSNTLRLCIDWNLKYPSLSFDFPFPFLLHFSFCRPWYAHATDGHATMVRV